MRRFIPGVDSADVPGVVRASELVPGEDPGDRVVLVDIALIADEATTLVEKYRRLCYWRQVVNAESN